MNTLNLTILSVNDVYDVYPDDQHCGGIAQLCTLLEKERLKLSSRVVWSTINGDFLSASQAAVALKGKHMIELMNALKMDFAVLGNHEFDFGSDELLQRMKESEFTWLGSNVLDKKSEKLFGNNSKRTYMYKCPDAGITVGVFGVCTEETPVLSYPGEGVEFADVLEVSKQCIAELKQEGADVIVAFTHLSIAHDKLLAKKVAGIDVIVGGHDHQPFTLYQGETFIHKSGQNAKWLVRLDLSLVRDGDKVRVFPEWQMILNRNVEPNEECLGIIDKHFSTLEKSEMDDEFVAVTTVKLDTRSASVRSGNSNFADMVADALRKTLQADFALLNGGFLRANKEYEAKTRITVGILKDEMPFQREAVAIRLLGEDLKTAMEQHLLKYPALSGGHPHISGFTAKYALNEHGQRSIVSMKRKNGEDIDLTKYYIVATTSFVARGGDGCDAWKRGKLEKTSDVVSSIVTDYLTKLRTISFLREEPRLVINVNE